MLLTVALCLFGHIEPSHFAGALAGEPEDLSGIPVAELTEPQLRSEFDRLAAFRTEFIGPVVMTASGGVVLIVGVVFGLAGVVYSILPSALGGGSAYAGLQLLGYILLGVGGAFIVAGGIVLAIGLVKLFPALARRKDATERREEIQKRLDALDPSKQPPPSEVRPGDVMREGPLPSLVLATF